MRKKSATFLIVFKREWIKLTHPHKCQLFEKIILQTSDALMIIYTQWQFRFCSLDRTGFCTIDDMHITRTNSRGIVNGQNFTSRVKNIATRLKHIKIQIRMSMYSNVEDAYWNVYQKICVVQTSKLNDKC